MKKAIILLNMGGARNAGELKEFLFNMFRDKRIIANPTRYLLAPVIANFRYKKVWKKYQLTGGSRIYKLTEALVNEMKKMTDWDVVYSMRYTKPNLNNIIHSYNKVILIPMYPHYSTTTVESHLDEIKQTKFKGEITIIPPFYNKAAFNKIVIQNITNSVENTAEWHLIFSAHGLPEKIINNGDYYTKHIKNHIEILRKKLTGFKSITLAYQSRLGPVKWIKPYLEEHLANYSGKNVLIYPISFMIDNSETDIELKIDYADLANKMGINKYKVVNCPNSQENTARFLLNMAIENQKPAN